MSSSRWSAAVWEPLGTSSRASRAETEDGRGSTSRRSSDVSGAPAAEERLNEGGNGRAAGAVAGARLRGRGATPHGSEVAERLAGVGRALRLVRVNRFVTRQPTRRRARGGVVQRRGGAVRPASPRERLRAQTRTPAKEGKPTQLFLELAYEARREVEQLIGHKVTGLLHPPLPPSVRGRRAGAGELLRQRWVRDELSRCRRWQHARAPHRASRRSTVSRC